MGTMWSVLDIFIMCVSVRTENYALYLLKNFQGFKSPQKIKDDVSVVDTATKSTFTGTSPIKAVLIPEKVYPGKKRPLEPLKFEMLKDPADADAVDN
ncbi:hypothetical protein HUJ05_000732 [Dendroctonus ponderosae]|nr:hypothetical protein HUJ05_000732 [Dendroctonus ponderosae]